MAGRGPVPSPAWHHRPRRRDLDVILWIYMPQATTPSRTRTQVLVLRLNSEERALLEALAENMSLKLSDTMRQAIRAEAKRRGIAVVASGKSKRRRK
jgi:hypothetical protein